MIIAMAALLAAVMLSGCGASMDLQSTLPMETQRLAQQQALEAGCRQFYARQEAARAKAQAEQLGQLDAQGKLYAVMNAQTMHMIEAVMGKHDQCRPGTNVWDAYIADVRARNAAAGKVAGIFGDTLTSVAPWVASVGIAHEVGQSAGTHVKGSGQVGDTIPTTTTTTTISGQ